MGGEDRDYLAAVRQLPCCVLSGGCRGAVQAHHAGRRPGVSLKAHDRTTIPLCQQHHTDWHAASGPFRTWRRADRERWSDEMIARTQARIDRIAATEVAW